MRYILLMFFVISAFSVKAQKFDEDKKIDQLVPGYVILEQGDSVKGKIKVQTRSKNQVRVKFTDKEGKKFTYKPKEILGYGYQTVVNNDSRQVVYYWRHFHQKKADMAPVPFGSKTVFMEVKAYGKAILYSYYVQRNEEVAMTYMHFYYLKFEDGSRERMITQDDFDWAVPAFLEDCKKIGTIVGTRMGFSNLEEIVEIYNNCAEYQIAKPDCDCDDITKEKKNKNQHSNDDEKK